MGAGDRALPGRATALAHLRRADPVIARLIDAHPDFDPRAWLAELPHLDAFGALVFQVIGQQLSVFATRRILDRVRSVFGGRMPTPADVLAADPAELHRAGLSRRKVETIRSLARLFTDEQLIDQALRALADDQIQPRPTALPAVGPVRGQ